MLQHIRQLSLLNKIFNVKGNEWSRISIAWFLSLLYRVGFVVGWTLIVGLFVSRFGISKLPYLFVMNAVLTMAGSLFYSVIIEKFRPVNVLVSTLFISAFVLSLAYYFISDYVLFFAFLLVAEATFLVQFRIRLHGFVEEMFTPIQSERTFPLIESAETIGGIFAGLMVVLLSSSINLESFVLIWIILVLLMIPFVFICEFLNKKVLTLSESINKREKSYLGVFSKIKTELGGFKRHLSYIKGILILVFLQWLLFNLLEFQYTKAVFQNVSDVIFEAGGGFEHAFVHDLGELFILFSASALLIQLFLGSRLIKGLGVSGSMILHPLVTLLSLLGLLFSFNFTNAVIAKNNFTITTIIHTNSYHSSYYAIKESLREYVREFADGFIRPFGAIFGTLIIIILQRFFISESLTFSINALMIFAALIFLFITILQKRSYTHVALNDFKFSRHKEERINAIDILSQKGHFFNLSILGEALLDKNELLSIKIRILRAFSEIKSPASIEYVLSSLSYSDVLIRKASIEALLSLRPILDHKIILELERCFKNELDSDVRLKILVLISSLSNILSFEFLISVLKKSRGKFTADVIYALGKYSDPAVSFYIRPFLSSENPSERLFALVALGNFNEYRAECLNLVKKLLKSSVQRNVIRGLFASGELKIRSNKKLCIKYLNSSNVNVRISSAIALAKMGYFVSISPLVGLLFGPDKSISLKVKNLLENVDVRIYKNIARIVEHLASSEIEKIISESGQKILSKMRKKDLSTLLWLYALIDEYDEVNKIKKLI
jgi:HEAT repeat protein/ATP/ADP translocase